VYFQSKNVFEQFVGTHTCSDYQNCKKLNEGFSCECLTGFIEKNGHCKNIDECLIDPCDFPNSMCHDIIGSFICECLPGL
jgi:hypothetical protein